MELQEIYVYKEGRSRDVDQSACPLMAVELHTETDVT